VYPIPSTRALEDNCNQSSIIHSLHFAATQLMQQLCLNSFFFQRSICAAMSGITRFDEVSPPFHRHSPAHGPKSYLFIHPNGAQLSASPCRRKRSGSVGTISARWCGSRCSASSGSRPKAGGLPPLSPHRLTNVAAGPRTGPPAGGSGGAGGGGGGDGRNGDGHGGAASHSAGPGVARRTAQGGDRSGDTTQARTSSTP